MGCLPDLLEQQVAARPDAVAVVCGDRCLMYRELAEWARGLAGCLGQLGVDHEQCVGVFVEPSLTLMIGVWGTLFAGGAYLPLSPEYPEDRLRYMIDDSRTRVIVTQDHLAARLAELAPTGTRIVTPADVRSGTTRAPAATVRPDSLAYVIYTSGSTGRPKGVMIEHRSIASQMRWMHAYGHLGQDTTVLQKTPMSFDAAQWEILAPAVGGRVAMGTRGIYRDPRGLVAAIGKHEVTTLQCVPTLLQALLDTGELGRCTSLRRVFSGGEVLSWRLARALADELPWASLVNLYGPTESTINATACLVDPDAAGDGAGSVSIGVPVSDTQCFILDADLAPVDIGETGELYIGGIQLARGYLNRPDQTRERFIASPFTSVERLYRTGDLAYWNPDGTIQFAGRADNQVKLRGHRIELDEIALALEEHIWVRRAAAVVSDNPRTGSASLVACVELNPKEAALMDQGKHGAHHQSKASRLQVRAQLSNPGLRRREQLAGRPVVELPGSQETSRQRREVFARKTYRFYDGAPVTRAALLALLAERSAGGPSRGLDELTFAELGELLRWFGAYRSDQRLLPKYAYASPGALYATQLYLETGSGIAGLEAGVYYYHPVDHTLVRTGPPASPRPDGGLQVHFLGRKRAIEPVYKNNLQEVLEIEAGHMVGLFEDVLPEYGLTIRPLAHDRSVKDLLDVSDEDYYLGTFAIRPAGEEPWRDPVEIYVQSHPGRVPDLPTGQYHYTDGELERVSDDLVLPKHVIAINQQVYQRASFGITAVSRADQPWLEYIALGRKLHHLQRNSLNLGFMSSGYSSKTGHPLPAAQRIDDLLAAHGIPTGPSYFFLGGRISDEQIRSEGMREDTVHMKGPAEIVKDELAHILPGYMVPDRVLVLDRLPLTANGKVDVRALTACDQVRSADRTTPYVAPATPEEKWLAEAWGKALKYDNVSTEDNFFACGGDSLTAVELVMTINHEFGTQLPLQVVFAHPKLSDLAARIADRTARPSSRLIPLHDAGAGRPVFCWPGLGGYPMNLRLLARQAGMGRPFHGIQAYGINPGEEPYPTVREMAAADLAEIRRVQTEGPYTLWGYSFGARVAFEAAWQLEQSGRQVDNLLLLCPGNPKIHHANADRYGRRVSYANPTYLAILCSVFTGTTSGLDFDQCLATARDEDTFVTFIRRLRPTLDEQLIRRITRIVAQTYEFQYNVRELAERRLRTPVTLFKATGDDYSFLETWSGSAAATPPTVINLHADHYSALKATGIIELASAIQARMKA
ncbi:amino acid adenylation domain-containing protein [Streptomyces halobius]|uniref:Amino acid adenylation domain-containing protein n=2 Tax=Streptomyces halobius TaxID=2879846 RepID=A0ABY4MJY8_9ACTN|nr:amino acid adenylation domain-containing protein [Streptomyces halobius]UQA98154.1 amino acid adenylation domain-containing protein [Streptomyces halobius]